MKPTSSSEFLADAIAYVLIIFLAFAGVRMAFAEEPSRNDFVTALKACIDVAVVGEKKAGKTDATIECNGDTAAGLFRAVMAEGGTKETVRASNGVEIMAVNFGMPQPWDARCVMDPLDNSVAGCLFRFQGEDEVQVGARLILFQVGQESLAKLKLNHQFLKLIDPTAVETVEARKSPQIPALETCFARSSINKIPHRDPKGKASEVIMIHCSEADATALRDLAEPFVLERATVKGQKNWYFGPKKNPQQAQCLSKGDSLTCGFVLRNVNSEDEALAIYNNLRSPNPDYSVLPVNEKMSKALGLSKVRAR